MTETHVFFGVFDFGADLDGVTAIMGVAPTAGWIRGDPIPPHATAKRTHCRWTLHSGLPADSPFEEHLSALLDKLEPLADRVRRVASHFSAVVWAAIYTADPNPGLRISASEAGRLAVLGLDIEFDIYRLPIESRPRETRPSNSPQEPASREETNRES